MNPKLAQRNDHICRSCYWWNKMEEKCELASHYEKYHYECKRREGR